jgi:alanine racemase
MNSRNTVAQIDLSALAENFRTIRERLTPQAFVCPMVKANAYGHGAVLISKALSQIGADALGVITLEEALELRDSGIALPILVFGTSAKLEVQTFREKKLTYVVSELEVLQELAKQGQSVHVHLKFNTGMNRMGLKPTDALAAHDLILQNKALRLKGICTHFLNGEDIQDDHGYSKMQVDLFKKVYEVFRSQNILWHMYNSSSLFRFLPATSQDPFLKIQGARPGISLYGETPYATALPNLKSVMTVKSQIEHLHRIRRGESVSYGPRWKAEKDSTIGVVSIGYADGFPRSLSNRASMLVRGRRVPVIGTVCMDYVMVDLTGHPEKERIARGESITVIGRDGSASLSAHELATNIDTIPYEILTKIGNRIPRIAVQGGIL